MKNVKEKTNEINMYAKQFLTESRYLHSVRVAEYAKHLSEIYTEEEVDPNIAYFAGLSHDICKNSGDTELVKITEEDGLGIDEVEKKRLNLLHGRASAIILKNKFGIKDQSVLNAVAFHTFGYEDIDALGKIIFIADKIEPGREPETEKFRNLAGKISLNELMLKVIDDRSAYILKKNGSIHENTKKMYNKIKLEELK